MTKPIERVLIVGAGWTGKQIASQIAAFGLSAFVVDSNTSILANLHSDCLQYAQEQVLSGLWSQEQIDALKRNLHVLQQDLRETRVDLILESVSESSSIKRKVLKEYSSLFDEDAVIASNSSYFLPSQLSRYVVKPERFAHLHFHVPVAYANLVDIVPCAQCDPSVVQRLTQFAEKIGQVPLVQTTENPGYVFNWMLQSVLKSALQLIDNQVATPAQIELAWKTVTKMPLGPIGIIDRIGVDVVLQVLRNARWSGQDESIDRLIAILEPLVEQGKLGWKTGEGFFKYNTQK